MSIPQEADTLQEFVQENAQKNTGTKWQVENPYTLEINLQNEQVYLKNGSMVAYYGQIKFEHTRGAGGGLGRFIKQAVTGEAQNLMKASGAGTMYVADVSKRITLLTLNNETIFLNGNDMLAYQDGLDWDIVITRGGGMAAGGLFSIKMSGQGLVAFTTHGNPLVLPVTPQMPLLTDPNATVLWSGGLTPTVRTDINFKTLLGRSSGETFQLQFNGEGFVVVQPYEEIVAPTSGSSGAGKGILGQLGV